MLYYVLSKLQTWPCIHHADLVDAITSKLDEGTEIRGLIMSKEVHEKSSPLFFFLCILLLLSLQLLLILILLSLLLNKERAFYLCVE